MNADWDVVVVGAGQAGCAAAWDLAAAGLTVLMLDRKGGKAKPCAGGVTAKALARYRFSIDAVIRERIETLHLSHYPDRETRLGAGAPFCVMTERAELDAYCLQQARQQGAEYLAMGGIQRLTQLGGQVQLLTREGRRLTATALIAADGAHSPVRRLLGERNFRGAMAIEALLPREQLSYYPGMTLDFAAIPGGYGWLFPKGDHVNAGLYVWRQGCAVPSREALREYCRWRLGCTPQSVAGYPLGTWLPQSRLLQGRVLFAGDAAGCTEALLGEGIYGAVLSGQLAAQAMISGELGQYPQLLSAWRDELRRVTQLGQMFYGLLPVSTRILQGAVGRILVNGFADGLTLGQCKRRWRKAG